MSENNKIEKYEKDENVAVLISGGFGAGWSTWNHDESVFNKQVVEHIIEHGKISEEAAQKIMGEDFYCGGAEGLRVEWVDSGDAFRVSEYDGNESLEIIGEMNHLIA